MVDAISDKGSALASTKAKSKLNTLNAKYGALCQAAQAQVRHTYFFKQIYVKPQDICMVIIHLFGMSVLRFDKTNSETNKI